MTSSDNPLQSTELWLIRHADTRLPREDLVQTPVDAPLSPLGKAQAERLAQRLKGQPFDALYSSDTARALDTARYISDSLGLDLQPDVLLRERDFGSWSALTEGEVAERYPEEWAAYRQGDQHSRFGGGESLIDIQRRVVSALDDIARRHSGERVLVVSHGGAIRYYVSHLLGLPVAQFHRLEADSTAIFRVRPFRTSSRSGDERPGVVMTLNDTCHLEGL